ncbi:MAG: hypothetical protein EOM21_20940 [Gammaproteobacteria bacterium]|nr:hypothetical protein [Gammaproteobacteria bacterium]
MTSVVEFQVRFVASDGKGPTDLCYFLESAPLPLQVGSLVELGDDGSTSPVKTVFFSPHEGPTQTIRLETVFVESTEERLEMTEAVMRCGWLLVDDVVVRAIDQRRPQ